MRIVRITAPSAFGCWIAMLALSPSLLHADTPATIKLPVNLYSGASYPEMKPTALIEVHLNGDADLPNALALRNEINSAEQHGWNCSSKSSYAVTVSGSNAKPLPIAAILSVGRGKCTDPVPAPVLIQLNAHVDAKTEYIVTLVGFPGGKTIASNPQAFPAATTNSFSLVPQGVPAESLTNGKTRDVGQLTVSYMAPFVANSPIFVSSNNLFSTDEKDSKSAFALTGGVSRGLFNSVYIPAQLSETIQGNQVATSLSAVSSLSITGLVPWYWTHNALNNSWIDAGLSPEFSFAALYTRRFKQQVTAETPLLSENDASLNPALVVEPFYLFPNFCARYRKWINAKPANNVSRQFCLGYQVDLGAWYLPLDKTARGSQQFEGYGDVSILVPLSNLNFNKFNFVQQDNLLSSQLHIEYSDSVNAANNYARSRQWTFGIEVMK